jgi:hypothetical protein
LKPESESDKFFTNYDELDKVKLIEKVELLERINKTSYSQEKEQINMLSIGKFSARTSEYLEEILTNTYFDGFKRRWIAFVKADLVLKIIYLLFVMSGFYFFGYLLYVINFEKDPEVGNAIFVIPFVLFPFSLLISVMYMGLTTLILTLLRFMLPKNGALIKLNVYFDELIKALKPGGRNTRVEIPSINWDAGFH